MELTRRIIDGEERPSIDDVKKILENVHELYSEKPNVVSTPNTSIYYIGDLHGEYQSAKTVAEKIQHSKAHFVFLGDYADRGPAQVETVILLLALAIEYPKRVTLLRGNHESEEIAKSYGFYMDISRKYRDSLFYNFIKTYSVLPLAGLSRNGIFCCHGGIPEGVKSIDQIQTIDRFDPNFPDDIAFQIVWNDPVDASVRFRRNMRSSRAREFGEKAFQDFCEEIGVNLFFRAHEAYKEGYKTFFDNKLVSIFSTSYRDKISPKVAFVDTKIEYEIESL
ncbi:MAG: hypothetical protein GF411_03575 [Candidatus Lokiarchaeota archaeon]|nr:hypothetical protein [Candidatus Lokiarchaeota archaeon]